MNPSLSLATLAQSTWHDFRRTWSSLLLFEMLFKLLESWLLVPIIAFILSVILKRSGHSAVSNADIVDFLLTPTGLIYASIFGTITVAMTLVQLAGVQWIASWHGFSNQSSVRESILRLVRQIPRLIQLGAILLAILTLIVIPFVLLALLTYHGLLGQHDIYYYLQEQPPVFWLAAGLGGILILGLAITVVMLLTRWALALPILLFENQTPLAALSASRDRSSGYRWPIAILLLGWLLGSLLFGLLLNALFQFLAATILELTGDRPVVLLLLLLAQGILVALLSFITLIGLGLLLRRIYQTRREQLGFNQPEPIQSEPLSAGMRLLTVLSLLLMLLAPLGVWANLQGQLSTQRPVEVTAHRGHAKAAPENTLSSIRKAIASGADYAEVDVHQTADGVVVLLHDRDLKRVAGVSRRLDAMTYAEVAKLDVGSWFDRAFAGERVPTLAEVFQLARGQINLNIELKLFGPDQQLARAVARLIREHHFEADCIVTSFSQDALQDARQENPGVKTGLIVGTALGDISRLDVEVLSVRADHLSDSMLRQAHQRGREVHVWTVNDPRQMFQLIKRGIDNLITSDPDLAIQVRSDWNNLTGPERLLIASKILLGLQPSSLTPSPLESSN